MTGAGPPIVGTQLKRMCELAMKCEPWLYGFTQT